MTTIINGKELAKQLTQQHKERVAQIKSQGASVKLVVITVGQDPASKVYVGQKEKKAVNLGMEFEWVRLDEEISQEELHQVIQTYNQASDCHALLVQLPLPDHLNPNLVAEQIAPHKDVDGLHPYNLGQLARNQAQLIPCTPKGIMYLLDQYDIDLTGRQALIIGRSQIVGTPLSLLMTQADATVTLAHSKTQNLEDLAGQADIIVSAVGKPNVIPAAAVKDGAVLIDVGINRQADGKLVGDFDYESMSDKASAITPVPGGVGPMTVAMLMEQTIACAIQQQNLELD